MKRCSMILALCLMAVGARAELKTKLIDYKDGRTKLQGYLAWDDSFQGKRPGIVVFHEWWGRNDYVDGRAEQLAKLGYVAFAGDMYGKGIVTSDFKKAGELSGAFKKDFAMTVRRANAALDVLKKQDNVDTSKIAAMGYCFGGGVALQLARSGADLKGSATFHSDLSTSNPGADNIKGKILEAHGADDPFVNLDAVRTFEDEMKKAGADWEVDVYSHAVHAFTNPANGTDPSKGLAYNAEADHRSWQRMQNFFEEIFK